MSRQFVCSTCAPFYIDLEKKVVDTIFQQYERVIVESIITSFGLDFLVADQHGGDVDTIHNVRQVGTDEQMVYKSADNASAYESRETYDSHAYHSDPRYKEKNRTVKEQRVAGTLIDSYTGERIARNGATDLDHIISAKEIHDDPGRVLSGLRGVDLANSPENLMPTNPHTNRTKKADSMTDFLDKYGSEYTEAQKESMRTLDAKSRKAYEAKLAQAYYTSPRFAADLSKAAGTRGVQMGLRQAFGFIFAEIWFSVKEEFEASGSDFKLDEFLCSVGRGVQKGADNARIKYKDFLAKFGEGVTAGVFASLTTSLSNIFFTTARNIVKIIRETWSSVVQATKILLLNPDDLLVGERVRAATNILCVGASIVVGSTVSELLNTSAVATIPGVGDIVCTFCGTLVTGIMSCTLLYFLDRSTLVHTLVAKLNEVPSMSMETNYYRRCAELMDAYATELMKIDLDKFVRETEQYKRFADEIEQSSNESALNSVLHKAFSELGIKLPWEGDFDSFMKNKTNQLVFE